MNMIMDSGHSHAVMQRASPLQDSSSPSPQQQLQHHPQSKDLQISTTPPTPPNEDSHQQLSPRTPTATNAKTTTLKRSFDVAFLMMPDERLKGSQPPEKQKIVQQQYQPQLSKQQAILRQYPQITVRTPRIYDDPTLVISPVDWESHPLKSAFTKVTSRLESPGQPAPSLSPDQLSCSSMSPPVATTPPRSASGSSNDIISIDSLPSSPAALSPTLGYQNFRPEYNPNGAFQSVQNLQAQQRLKQQFLYRAPIMNSPEHQVGPPPPSSPPGFIPVYPGFPFPPNAVAGGMPHPFGGLPHPEMMPRMVQNPAAAAILSTLIPPTLASTFTLTAQNVCAKCNISFRMTSDLVYHMRSHHKSEVATDPNRRKREEKLKCPVCQETFRERHHLTRHMTAHQDKASDQTAGTNPSSATNNNNNHNNNDNSNYNVQNAGMNSNGNTGSRMHSQRSSAAYSK